MADLSKLLKAARCETKAGPLNISELLFEPMSKGEVLLKPLAYGVYASDLHVQDAVSSSPLSVVTRNAIGSINCQLRAR